jgi:hypothetical protein
LDKQKDPVNFDAPETGATEVKTKNLKNKEEKAEVKRDKRINKGEPKEDKEFFDLNILLEEDLN